MSSKEDLNRRIQTLETAVGQLRVEVGTRQATIDRQARGIQERETALAFERAALAAVRDKLAERDLRIVAQAHELARERDAYRPLLWRLGWRRKTQGATDGQEQTST